MQTGCCSVALPRPLRSNNTIKAPLEQLVKPPGRPSAPWNPLAPVSTAGLTHLLINPQDLQHCAGEIARCSVAALLGPHLIDMAETFQPFDGAFPLPAAAIDGEPGLRSPWPDGEGGQHENKLGEEERFLRAFFLWLVPFPTDAVPRCWGCGCRHPIEGHRPAKLAWILRWLLCALGLFDQAGKGRGGSRPLVFHSTPEIEAMGLLLGLRHLAVMIPADDDLCPLGIASMKNTAMGAIAWVTHRASPRRSRILFETLPGCDVAARARVHA